MKIILIIILKAVVTWHKWATTTKQVVSSIDTRGMKYLIFHLYLWCRGKTQHSVPPLNTQRPENFAESCGRKYLNTRFPVSRLLTLLFAGYSVKLKIIIGNNNINIKKINNTFCLSNCSSMSSTSPTATGWARNMSTSTDNQSRI